MRNTDREKPIEGVKCGPLSVKPLEKPDFTPK